MKKLAKYIYMCTLLFTGTLLAQTSIENDESTGPVFAYYCDGSSSGFYDCFVKQFSSAQEALAAGYTSVHYKWNEAENGTEAFVTSFSSAINGEDVNGRDLRIFFRSDIDLGSYKVSGTDTTCVNSFSPISFNGLANSVTISGEQEDGSVSTVRGFCYINDGTASFFNGLENADVVNIAFDSAYVKANYMVDVMSHTYAAVVVDQSTGGFFDNVVVTNAVVVSPDIAAGIVAYISGGELYTPPTFENVKVKGQMDAQIVGGIAGVFDCGSLRGGNFTISSSEVSLVAQSHSYQVGDVRVGGLVGMVDFGSDGNGVNVVASGNTVNFDVSLETFDEISQSSQFLGGLLGYVGMGRGSVQLSGNKVESANISNSRQSSASICLGGEIGYFYGANYMAQLEVTSEKVNVTMDVDVEAAQYLGGILGKMEGVLSDTTFFFENQVNADIDSKSAGARMVALGGLAAYIEELEDETAYGLHIGSGNNVLTLGMKAASKNIVYGGGLFGYVKTVEGNEIPKGGLTSVYELVQSRDGENIVEATAADGYVYVGGLLGYEEAESGYCKILTSRIEGNLKVASTSSSGAMVGGVGGSILMRSGYIGKNVVLGDIVASAGTVGYMVGFYAGSSEDDSYGLSLFSNYHYGENDANIAEAVGVVYVNNAEITDWKSAGIRTGYKIVFNYRNALGSDLVADGAPALNGYGMVKKGQDSLYNGVVSEADMKTRLFAYTLNSAMASIYDSSAYNDAWENSKEGLPYIVASEYRTVYQLYSDMSSVYSELTKADKDTLDGYLDSTCFEDQDEKHCEYSLFAYTDSQRKFSGLSSKIKALSVDLAFVEEGFTYDLESQQPFYDLSLSSVIDMDLVVVYEMEAPSEEDQGNESEELISMDDYSVAPLYLWPQAGKTKLYKGVEPVPPIYMNVEGTYKEYRLSRAYANCRADAPNCNPMEYFSEAGQIENMYFVKEELRYMGIGEYSDTLHLVYAPLEENNDLPLVYFGSTENRGLTTVTSYGYQKGKLTAWDSVQVNQLDVETSLSVASKFGIHVEKGFVLKSWTVDFWLTGAESPEAVTTCYEQDCESVAEQTGVSNYIASFAEFDKLMQEEVLPPYTKWTVTLDSGALLDMDTLVTALTRYGRYMGNYVMYANVVPELEAIPYKIHFDANTETLEVFLTDHLQNTETYSRENEETAMLPILFSSTACYNGWGEKAVDPEYQTWNLDASLIEMTKPKNDEFNVYAQWVDAGSQLCPEIVTVPLTLVTTGNDKESSKYGTVSLWQSYLKLGQDTVRYDHAFEGGKMDIPETGMPMTFNVASNPADGYKLARLYLARENGAGTTVERDTTEYELGYAGTTFGITPEPNYEYTLIAKFGRVLNVALDLNGDHGDVFYGMYSRMDSLMVVEGGQVELPAWIYTSNSCVLGWSLDSDAKDNEYRGMVNDDELYEKVSKTGALYAVWGDAGLCVDSAKYWRVSLSAEHGSVQFMEWSEADDSSYVHSFAEDGTMLLPEGMEAPMVLRGAPEAGYKLDSLVIETLEERYVLEEGDTLPPFQPEVSMKAYFSEDSDGSELEPPLLLQSGNAVQLSFNADESRSPSLQVWLMDAQGVELEKTEPLKETWEKYSLLPGSYVIKAVLFDARDTVSLDTAFKVSDEIAAAPDTWRMVSLSDVVSDSLMKDDDQVLFRWDETAVYGEYWKYQRYKDDEINPVQGYWYNSLEGRPLMLRRDSARTGSEIVWEIDSGWTMVANPYGWGVELDSVLLDSLLFSAWDSEKAESAWNAYLGPYEAAWVYSESKKSVSVDWEPMFDRASVQTPGFDYPSEEKGASAKVRPLAKASARDNWSLQVVLTDARGHRDSWNILGVGTPAERLEPPTGMGDLVNLSVLNGKRALAKSVLKSASEGNGYSWQVALSASSDRVGYLKFNGLADLAGYGYRVFVTLDGVTREVTAGDSLRVLLKAAGTTATVRVQTSDIKVVESSIGKLHLVQQAGKIQVGFDVTEGLAGANCVVELVGLDGKVKASYGARALLGYNTASLDAPRSGLYLLRVRVGREQASRKVAISR